MTRDWLGMEPFRPSRRFTAWLHGTRRGAQLHQKGRHGSANLYQGQNRTTMLPRSVHPFDQGTSEHQLVVRAGHDLRPAFGLLRRAQTRDVPEQDLFVQPIAMFVRVAQPIRRADLGQRCGFIAFPDKPTDLRITLTSTHRAVRKCNWFQHRTSTRLPLASVPSQQTSGSPWLLSSLHWKRAPSLRLGPR